MTDPANGKGEKALDIENLKRKIRDYRFYKWKLEGLERRIRYHLGQVLCLMGMVGRMPLSVDDLKEEMYYLDADNCEEFIKKVSEVVDERVGEGLHSKEEVERLKEAWSLVKEEIKKNWGAIKEHLKTARELGEHQFLYVDRMMDLFGTLPDEELTVDRILEIVCKCLEYATGGK